MWSSNCATASWSGVFGAPPPRLSALTRPSVIHEEAPRDLRRERVELRAMLEAGLILTNETHPRLVDERRRLQRVAGSLAAEVRVGDLAQLAVDDRHQRIERAAIAFGPLREQLRYIA